MKFLLPRVALTSITLGVCASGYAQEPVPIEFYRPLKNSVSVGVRMIGGNAKVKFGNLGTVPHFYSGLGATVGSYNNGGWAADVQSGDESAANTSYGPTSTTPVTEGTVTTQTWIDRIGYAADGSIVTDMALATRYRLVRNVSYNDSNPANAANNYTSATILGEFVNYNPTTQAGLTRDWGYNSTSQIGGTPGNAHVDLSRYDVRSSGGTADAESDQSAGVELQFAHIIKRYKRFEWGINFAAGASTINAKKRDRVRSTLFTTTDRYRIVSPDSNDASVDPASFPDWWYSNRSSGTAQTVMTTGTGAGFTATEYTYFSEQAKFLNTNPLFTNQITTQDINVEGYWQIKGAYYMLRVGPIVRFPIAKNWTVSASAGAAGAYVGTKFTIDEYITLDDVAGTLRYQSSSLLFEKENMTEEKRFIPGYYVDVNIERWLTVRTGVYVGYGHESLGKYTQTLRGRTADIDLGTSSGFRFGIITRF
jgi:hypothetical protein